MKLLITGCDVSVPNLLGDAITQSFQAICREVNIEGVDSTVVFIAATNFGEGHEVGAATQVLPVTDPVIVFVRPDVPAGAFLSWCHEMYHVRQLVLKELVPGLDEGGRFTTYKGRKMYDDALRLQQALKMDPRKDPVEADAYAAQDRIYKAALASLTPYLQTYIGPLPEYTIGRSVRRG